MKEKRQKGLLGIALMKPIFFLVSCVLIIGGFSLVSLEHALWKILGVPIICIGIIFLAVSTK